MPKRDKHAIRPRQLIRRRNQHKERRQREDWIQCVMTAAQLASSIAAMDRRDQALSSSFASCARSKPPAGGRTPGGWRTRVGP
jgi:hypothetical protein